MVWNHLLPDESGGPTLISRTALQYREFFFYIQTLVSHSVHTFGSSKPAERLWQDRIYRVSFCLARWSPQETPSSQVKRTFVCHDPLKTSHSPVDRGSIAVGPSTDDHARATAHQQQRPRLAVMTTPSSDRTNPALRCALDTSHRSGQSQPATGTDLY